MPKRFRDTGLWDKEWYVALSCVDRCVFDYILCRCDPVGVWCPAFTVAERLIGEKVDWKAFPGKVNGNLKVLENGKWWIVDFCKYQYGKINESSNSEIQKRLHMRLVEHGLWEMYLSTLGPTLPSTVGTSVGASAKEEEEDNSSSSKTKNSPEKMRWDFEGHIWYGISDEQVEIWQEAYPAVDVELELRQIGSWCEANGAKGHKQNWKRFITNWLKRAQDKPGVKR